METAAQSTTLTTYAALEEHDQYVTELVCGQIIREPRPGHQHGRLQVTLGYHLKAWALRRGEGEVYAESGFILADDPATVRGPDVAVVLHPGTGLTEPGGWIRGAPDLVAEIVSPSDTSRDMQQKVLEYLEAGSSLVWIVDGDACTVTVYRPDGSAMVVRSDGTLTGEEVLSGFSLKLADLFG